MSEGAIEGDMPGFFGPMPNPTSHEETNVYLVAMLTLPLLGVLLYLITGGDIQALIIVAIWSPLVYFIYWFKEKRTRPSTVDILPHGLGLRYRDGRLELLTWDKVIGIYLCPGRGSSFFTRRLRNGALRVAGRSAPVMITYEIADHVWNAYRMQTGRDPPYWDAKIFGN